jgi:hypothetical protein
VCQLVYFIALGDLYQNILLTFSMSVAIIFSADAFVKKRTPLRALLLLAVTAAVLFICVPLPKMLAERGFDIDYGLFGVLIPVAVYFMPNKPLRLLAEAVLILVVIWIHWALLVRMKWAILVVRKLVSRWITLPQQIMVKLYQQWSLFQKQKVLY